MREILLLSKRLIKAKEFERIALTNNINFEDLKDGYVKLYNSQDDYIDIYLNCMPEDIEILRDEKGKPESLEDTLEIYKSIKLPFPRPYLTSLQVNLDTTNLIDIIINNLDCTKNEIYVDYNDEEELIGL